MKNKKQFMLIILIISIIIGGGFSFLGYSWYHSVEECSQLKRENQQITEEYRKNIERKNNQIASANDRARLAIQNNTNPATPQNSEMFMTIKKVFKCFYNFNPDNYTTREAQIKNELSKEMRDQLFPQNVQNYQGTLTSKLEDIGVYSKIYYTKAGNKEALVWVKYNTHYQNQETHHLKQLWHVSYDVNKKQITNIEEVNNE